MAKKSPNTTNTQIRAACRRLFLRSRERGARIKADNYTCQECGVKQSRAKGREVYVEVHHKRGVLNWQMVFDAIREGLLCDPENLETLCRECHQRHTETESDNRLLKSDSIKTDTTI